MFPFWCENWMTAFSQVLPVLVGFVSWIVSAK